MNDTSKGGGGLPVRRRSIHPGSGRRKAAPFPRGRVLRQEEAAAVKALLGEAPREAALLIEYLHLIQDREGCLWEGHLQALAEELRMPMAQVYEVATFYAHFDVVGAGEERPPKVTVRVCDSLSCALAGGDELISALQQAQLPGVRVLRAPCIGSCHTAPAAEVGHRQVDHATAGAIAELAQRGEVHPQIPVYQTFEAYAEAGGYRVLRACLSGARQVEDVIAALSDGGLRGLGGAGFPTGRKWALVRGERAPRLMAVNGDEGEPGTFKDRVLLTRLPKQVFVGMIIAAHAVGARQGIVYLRAEYAYLRQYLEKQLAELREEGLLGNGFDIRIQSGAGSYVCGDESALIESCEGKRGTPRLKPPFPVEHGFLGKPTVVDNVETLAAATRIMDRGADWFAAMGTSESKGTRLLSVSGDCAAPGIYEIEWGISLGEVLEMVGAEDPRAVQISGPAGEMVSASADADRKIAFEDISCGGSFMVFNAQRDLLEVVRDFMQFFVDESCGICVPCRAGNVVLRQKVDLVLAGRADQSDLDDMVQWGGVIAKTSRCGLGTTSPNPIVTTLAKFPEIYSDRLYEPTGDLLPSFDIGAALGGYPMAMEQLAVQESR